MKKIDIEQEEIVSRELYRTLVENSLDGIYIISSRGFDFVNPAFERLSGYTTQEICDKGFNFLNLIHPDDRKFILNRRRARERKEKLSPLYEFRLITKSGEIRHIEVNTVPLKGRGMRVLGLVRDITQHKQIEEELSQTLEKLRKAMDATIQAITLAVELKDPYMAGHQRRVADLARAIADHLSLSKERIDGLRVAASIHDIGKLSVPSEILSKPGKINVVEFNLVKNHPQVGYEILKKIESPWPIAQIVLEHHERIDGSGYPSGLKGNEILYEAKILGVADVVEAMTSHRPYRQAFQVNKALEEITEHRGILYESRIVDVCLELFRENKFIFK